MGNGTSKSDDVEVNGKDALIDCPVLVDLGHGTIRHRMPDEKAPKDDKVKTGYFYHARLEDFSEDAVVSSDESYKLKYVFKGPAKVDGKRLFYVYGNNVNAEDAGIQRGTYKPKGKGFNWPESYRKANNLYYEIAILPSSDDHDDSDDDTLSVSSDISNDNESHNNSSKESITLKVKRHDSIESIKKRISIRLLIPTVNLHLMINKKEIDNEEIIGDIVDDEDSVRERFQINLKLL